MKRSATQTLLIAAIVGLAGVAAAQGLFSAGCSADDGSAPIEERRDADPPLSLQERLALCEADKPESCPGTNDDKLTRHGGLVAGAICQFSLIDQQIWESSGAALDALATEVELVDAAALLKDLDHQGVPMKDDHKELERLELMLEAFGWDAFDHGDRAWMPQGVSGSADAYEDERLAGRRVVAISWYHKPENSDRPGVDKGSRVSFVDINDLAAGQVKYTHALLVEPFLEGGVPQLRPLRIHVGGIAWVGRYLYAVDTMRGLRVFDTERLIKLGSLADEVGRDPNTGEYRAYGHRYALPQVGAYFQPDTSCWHRYSFIAVDRTAPPPSLVTGEFHDADVAGKLIRWDLDGERLALTDAGVAQPSEVYFAQESDVQGAVSVGRTWYLSASAQDGNWGLLYRTAAGEPSQSYGWVIGPEDLMYSRKEGALWSASEFAGRRYVFSVDVSKY
jgi:hypothetical protein